MAEEIHQNQSRTDTTHRSTLTIAAILHGYVTRAGRLSRQRINTSTARSARIIIGFTGDFAILVSTNPNRTFETKT